jgi:hypothetical protein
MTAIDTKSVPHYVALLDADRLRYKLDAQKRIMGNASDELVAFAEKHGLRIPSDVTAWDRFAMDCGLDREARKRLRCYLLDGTIKTDEDRNRLASM